MINWTTSKAYVNSLYAASVAAYSAEPSVPDSLRNWLARLRLLYGIPFNYLVPDSRLLPVESVRFFYIDRNFTDRLVDGAVSVGKATTREFLHYEQVHGTVSKETDDEEWRLRRQFRGEPLELESTTKAADLTGLLLRSRAVSGWPGLEVKAYRDTTPQTRDDGGTRLVLLRMDRLAPDVLLCIFEGVPTRVDIEEPREGIQFGVDAAERSTITPSGFGLKLRKIKGVKAGEQLASGPTAPVPVRRSNRQVVHVAALRDSLTSALVSSGDPDADPRPELTSGELALEMFQFPFRQRFEGAGGDPVTPGGRRWEVGSQYVNATLKVRTLAEPLSPEEVQVLFPNVGMR
ncbi:MAG: hypothetical protein ABI681_06695 [Gemmatimonadales bacterium]